MPGRHEETILAAHAAFNRDDTSWAQASVAADVVWGTTGTFPGMDRVYRGPGGVEEWMRTVRKEWEQFEVSITEVLAEANDALAVVERIWGKGRESGAEAEMSLFALYRFNADGLVIERRAFTSREAALAAL